MTTYLRNRRALCQYLGIGNGLVLGLIKNGLPEIKVGARKVIYRTDEVDTFMNRYKIKEEDSNVRKVVSRLMGGRR